MGVGKSKVAAAPPAAPAPPSLSPEAVDALCRDAYAAGVSDADMYNTAQREAVQRQDALAAAGACLLSGWLAYMYGRSSGVQAAEAVASPRLAAQQQQLEKASTELVALAEENKGLAAMQLEQQHVIAQQRSELARAAQQRRAMQHSLSLLRRRHASVRRQMRGLTASLRTIQQQMYVGMGGAAVLLLAVVWSTRPLRRRQPPLVPVAVAPVVEAEAATPMNGAAVMVEAAVPPVEAGDGETKQQS